MPKKQEKTDRSTHYHRAEPRGLVGGGSAVAKPGEKIEMEKAWHQTKQVKIRYSRDRRPRGAGVTKGFGAKSKPLN